LGTFPTVKSDPWRKGRRRRRRKSVLWTPAQWKQLTEAAVKETEWWTGHMADYRIGPAAFALICEFNGGQS
jgi:hypothetical protein